MTRCSRSLNLESLDEALGSLISAQIAFGKAALELFAESCGAAMDGLKKIEIPRGSACCDIPDPCWMPLDHGEVCCEIAPGDTGELCLVIGNGDFRPHDYRIVAAGEHAGLVAVAEPAIKLGPAERRTVPVRFNLPKRERPREESCCEGNDYEIVVWVQGCRNHYVRWSVNELEKGRKTRCCHEVVIDDEPDYELHWYDHFHIYRPCIGPQTAHRP